MDINKAKENLKGYLNWLKTKGFSMAENDEAIKTVLSELDKKDKIIKDMANSIYLIDAMSEYGNSRDEVIDYFTNKYEEGKGN